MEFSINVKNADESMMKAIIAMLETKPSINYKIIESAKTSRLKAAIAEVESGKTTKCKNFDDFKKKVLS